MAKITVLIPDGDGSKELTFNAARWAQATRTVTAGQPLDPEAGRLDLYAGKTVVASFPFGTYLGVWYSDRKATDRDRRF